MYILIVDDDELSRASLERLLLRDGHRICWASTGLGGLAMMRSEQPDLVFLDMMLGPAMNGWEVADAKKRDPLIAGIPTIVLTGLRAEDVRVRGTPHESVLSEILLIMSKPPEEGALQKAIVHIAALKALECA
jgi:CheY-like chemotaxis protein